MQRSLVLLAGALLLGGAAAWLTAGWLDQAANPDVAAGAAATDRARILVATGALQPGDVISMGRIGWQVWPKEALRPEYLMHPVTDPASLIGATVRTPIMAGQPLLATHIVRRGEQGVMAALIAPGHRAISIAVTASSGLAGFVGPGDRVDILLTAGIANGGGSRIMGQTVAENVRVMGIDQSIGQQTADLAGGAALQSEGQAMPPATITLEVTPRQAEAVAVAQELGKLSLSLRDLQATQAKGAAAASDARTWDSDVMRLPASAFSAVDAGLGGAAGQVLSTQGLQPLSSSQSPSGVQAAPGSQMVVPGRGAESVAGAAVETVNGVEIVRGSSNRIASASPAAAPAAVAQ